MLMRVSLPGLVACRILLLLLRPVSYCVSGSECLCGCLDMFAVCLFIALFSLFLFSFFNGLCSGRVEPFFFLLFFFIPLQYDGVHGFALI